VNGPDLYGKNLAIQGFVIGIASQQLVATFAPPSGTFSNPHDLAVSYDSNEVYVVELNPHRVWKFVNSAYWNNFVPNFCWGLTILENAVNSTIQRVEIKSPESLTREPQIPGDCGKFHLINFFCLEAPFLAFFTN
jgi:NHL repeat